MKKSTQIIIGHLIGQLIIVVIVIEASNEEFAGATLGGIGVVVTYITTGIITVMASIFTIYSIHKQPRTVIFKAVFFSICLWVFGPKLIKTVTTLMPHTSSYEEFVKEVKKPTMKAVAEMGFREFSWDSISGTCIVKLQDGRRHNLTLNGNYLNIYSNVRRPLLTDTLTWMSSMLLESIVYLKPKTCLRLSSCISSRVFDFSIIKEDQVSFKLGTTNPYEPLENWIQGETTREFPINDSLVNLCIKIYYGEQIQKNM